jgi:uncharacterized protein (DUF305 family)
MKEIKMTMKSKVKSKMLMATAALALIIGATAAHAEDHMAGMDHSKMDHSMMGQGGMYDGAMKTMHEGMASVKPTGDADVDFVAGMIPHHQGAIDMAKVVLEKGADPEIKKLAEGIIAAQESEIKLMNDWLKAHQK